MLKHLQFDADDFEKQKLKDENKTYWWEMKRKPPKTTSTIEAVDRALDVLGAEDILGFKVVILLSTK